MPEPRSHCYLGVAPNLTIHPLDSGCNFNDDDWTSPERNQKHDPSGLHIVTSGPYNDEKQKIIRCDTNDCGQQHVIVHITQTVPGRWKVNGK